jgi:hypothetical protein
VEHYNDAIEIGTYIAYTDTSLVVTPGTPVTVYAKGAPYVAFTSLENCGAGVIRCYWRDGAAHVEPTGKIQRAQSEDYGATWGAPSDIVDTPGVDDRDPFIGTVGGVSTLFWVRYLSEAVLQVFAVPTGGGAIWNVFGYPCASGTPKVTSLGGAADDGDVIASYGGTYGSEGWMVTRVGWTENYWNPPATLGEDVYRIFEPRIVRIPGGDLLVVARTGITGGAIGELLQMRSDDDGATWGSGQLFPDFHGTAPALLRMSTGTLVVVSNKVYVGGRPIYLSYSTTDGATWSTPVFIVNPTDSDSGYCGIIEIDSTHILISYYCVSGTTISVLPVTIESA